MGGRGDVPRPPMSFEEVEMAHGPGRSDVPRAELVIGDSARDAGVSFGAAHAAAIAAQVESYRPLYEVYGMPLESVAARAAEELVPPAEQVLPAFVEELRGRAEGSGVPFLELFLLNCQEEVSTWVPLARWEELEARWPSGPAGRGAHGCTTFAIRARGATVIGHTEDWTAVDLDNEVALQYVTAADGTRIMALQSPGILAWQGQNSHGVSLTANTVLSSDARPGVPNALVLRWALEAPTLEEVYRRLRLPERAIGTYVLAADASGRVWSIQTTATRASYRPVDEWVVQTNHYTHEELVGDQRPPEWPESFRRHDRASALVAAGLEDGRDPLELAASVVRDHGSGAGDAICVHPQGGDAPRVYQEATISCALYEPLARRMHVCVGPPCRSDLETFALM